MALGSAADFLIRAVLDEAFRELSIANPERAFEKYDLTPDQRESLRRRDGRVLGMLGDIVAPARPGSEPPVAEQFPQVANPPLPNLPEVKLLLRLTPRGEQLPGGASKISYAATLSPWPGDSQVEENAADQVAWVVRITPTALGWQETGLNVAYSAAIQPLAVASTPQTEATAGSPWNHQVDSDAAKAAAQAVRKSDADGRYERLLDLINALQPEAERG